jgi:hypothetical protein
MTTETKWKKASVACAKVLGGLILLGIIAHTVAVIITGASVRKAKQAIAAAGYPMSAAEIIPQRIENGENAAIELKKVFGLLTLGSDDMYSPGTSAGQLVKQYEDILKLDDLDTHAPYSDEQLAQLADIFTQVDLDRIFQLLTDAAVKGRCWFERSYGDGRERLRLGHRRIGFCAHSGQPATCSIINHLI